MDDEMKCGSSRKSHELQIARAAWSMDELTSNMHLHILTESLVSYLGNGLGCLILKFKKHKECDIELVGGWDT